MARMVEAASWLSYLVHVVLHKRLPRRVHHFGDDWLIDLCGSAQDNRDDPIHFSKFRLKLSVLPARTLGLPAGCYAAEP